MPKGIFFERFGPFDFNPQAAAYTSPKEIGIPFPISFARCRKYLFDTLLVQRFFEHFQIVFHDGKVGDARHYILGGDALHGIQR